MAKAQGKSRAAEKSGKRAKDREASKKGGMARTAVVKSATGFPQPASAAERRAFLKQIRRSDVTSAASDIPSDYDTWLG
jgi:hypothetical protein